MTMTKSELPELSDKFKLYRGIWPEKDAMTLGETLSDAIHNGLDGWTCAQATVIREFLSDLSVACQERSDSKLEDLTEDEKNLLRGYYGKEIAEDLMRCSLWSQKQNVQRLHHILRHRVDEGLEAPDTVYEALVLYWTKEGSRTHTSTTK